MVEALCDPLRAAVYISAYERPGASVSQIARRLGEPPRRIRHQVDRLLASGLLALDAEDTGPGGREHRFRAFVPPTVDERVESLGDEDRLAISISMTKLLAADIGRAIRNRTLGTRTGHAETRVPGEVDGRGRREIQEIMVAALEEVEATMVAAAVRLGRAGAPGIEVIAALLSFEAPAWESSEERRPGPRSSFWAEAVPGHTANAEVSTDLRQALVDVFVSRFRARVFIAVAERPGVTIAQIATRIEEPTRRVRGQVDQLVGMGLIVVDGETRRRNTRERHYRAVVPPAIPEETGPDWTDEQRLKVAHSVVNVVMSDLDAAIRGLTFARRPDHTVVRVPGEVDARGWDELAATMARTLVALETAFVASYARLAEEGRQGTEVIATLLLFEGAPWERGPGERTGPRPTQWSIGPSREPLGSQI
jgi:DNA-binding MarR family transcriptional regulator